MRLIKENILYILSCIVLCVLSITLWGAGIDGIFMSLCCVALVIVIAADRKRKAKK